MNNPPVTSYPPSHNSGLIALTKRFDEALLFASELHRQQVRKGTNVPYISHLLSVCALVIEAGGDEDQAIVALLHDAAEDQGGIPTLEKIRERFGARVAGAVEECSDSLTEDSKHKKPWRERKIAYLQHLKSASYDALIVAIADKLHNVQSQLADSAVNGARMWDKFNAGRSDQLWFYDALLDSLSVHSAKPQGLYNRLREAILELHSR